MGYWGLIIASNIFHAKIQFSLEGGRVIVHGYRACAAILRVLCGNIAVRYSFGDSS